MTDGSRFAESVFDRTPPYSLESEVAVLGAILIAPKTALPVAMSAIREVDFYCEANRRVYRAAVDLYERGDAIDVLTLDERLKETGESDAIGGIAYLGEILEAVPTAAHIETHAKIVRQKARLRAAISGASEVIREAYATNGDGVGAVAAAIEKLSLALEGFEAGGYRSIKETLWGTFEWIETLQERAKAGKTLGISTGFRAIDRMTSGLQLGELSIIAARPSMGKTSLGLDFVRHAAIEDGVPCGVQSIEMTRDALTMRLLCAEARVDLQRYRRGELEAEEHSRLAAAAARLNTPNILIDDHPIATLSEIAGKVTQLATRTGVQLLVVDYLQLLDGTGAEESRRLEIDALTRGLKHLARRLNIHVSVLSQLSRGPESRTNHRPLLSDLRESGSIEQDADLVIFLYRPEMYVQNGDTEEAQRKAEEARARLSGAAEAIVAKQRNGPTGTIPLFFRKECTRFETLDASEPR